MEQRLKLYRNHTPACIHGYSKPIYEGDNTVKDCACPINAIGYLKNECDEAGKPKRIQHRSLGAKDWSEARLIRDRWLEWGQTTQPLSGIDKLKRKDVTVQEAVQFFFDYSSQTDTKGDNTHKKYRVLLHRRFLPWCAAHGVRAIKEFDDPVTVKKFFMSWRNLNPTKNKKNVPVDLNKPLGTRTKQAELERYRSFLGFCQSNNWITVNYAKREPKPGVKGISVATVDVEQKVAFTHDEYDEIVKTLEKWHAEPGKVGALKAQMQHAFVLSLRYTGQRVSDISMLGPENLVRKGDKHFVRLTQIKTGRNVMVPAPAELVNVLRALPPCVQLAEPFALQRRNRTIKYGRKFWFWTGPENSDVDSNITHWWDSVAFILKRTQEQRGSFAHRPTPHSFRHYFAISMLERGVPIEQVSKWLGHASPEITAKHYSNANENWHDTSYKTYMAAVAV